MANIFASLFRTFYGARMKHFEGVPGPTPTFPFGNALMFAGNKKPWDVCADLAKEYGSTTLIWAFNRPTLILTDPDLIRAVLDTKFDDFYKDDPNTALIPTLRNSIFVRNPPEWNRLRQAHPCEVNGFAEWLPTQTPVVKKAVGEHFQRLLDSPNDVDILDKMQRMCFDAFNDCVIGRRLDEGAFDEFFITSKMATKRMKIPKFLLIPPINPRFHTAMKRHYGAFEKIVKEVRANLNTESNDLIHILLRQETELSDEQMATLVANVQAGGNFSAAAALVNTFYLLNHHPEVAEKLYAELTDFIKREPEFHTAALEQCKYLDCVLRESLRYLAPVPFYFRNSVTTKTVKLGKYELPPDTILFIMTGPVQRSANHWQDPDAFNPGRWENGVIDKTPLDSDYFFPFGRGPRMCPGADFVMFCMKIMLVSVLSKTHVKIDVNAPYEQEFHCGVAEPKGFRATIVRHA